MTATCLTIGVAALAACESGSGGSGGAAQSAPGTAAPVKGSAPSGSAKDVTDYPKYVGLTSETPKKANPSLPPVTLGWVNEQGGPPSQTFPEATRSAQAAVKFINTELGGIQGHPVKLATCFIENSEAQGTTCGQQLSNTKGIDVIDEGIVALGNASMYGTLNGSIPTIVGVSADPADDTGKNVSELEGSDTSSTTAFGPFLRKQFPSAHTVAIAYQNIPGAVPVSQAIQKSAQGAGFKVTMIPYSSTATDLIGPATEMEQSDIAVPDCGFADCPLMAKAINEIHGTKPALSVPLWTDLPASGYPGNDLPKWIVGEATANLAYTQDPGVADYYKTIEQYGLSKADAISPFAGIAFGSLLFTVKLMNQIGYAHLSPQAVTKAIKQYKGPIPLGPTSIDCTGKLYPKTTNVCSDYDQFFQYSGSGQWKLLQGWVN